MALKHVPSAAPWIPSKPTIAKLSAASKQCEGCELFRFATQTVFGEGPSKALVVMVGEQPGDQEDRAGKPFVGPAGRLLDRALADAGVDRRQVYVTNALKHFKFVERGKRRIHGKPSGIEISACRPWLEAELQVIQPRLLVCLGATAAQSLMGRDFRILRDRGSFFPHRWAKALMATIHPSALLRMPEPERRGEEYRLFVHDLALIPQYLSGSFPEQRS
jgi:uracil-DNA glycosylase